MYKIFNLKSEISKDLIMKFNIKDYQLDNHNYLIEIQAETALYAYAKDNVLYLAGNIELTKKLVNILIDYNFTFSFVEANEFLALAFFDHYNAFFKGSYFKVDNLYCYQEGRIKSIMLSGGCFWCVAKPYYEYDGINKVLSGFSGGTSFNPSYDETKKQKNNHKESILIYYDNNLINIAEILEIYLMTVDPFDSEGQFIDRGLSYTCSLYYKNEFEKAIYTYKLHNIELNFKKKVAIEINKDYIFYKAEEHHQDYAIKNPKQMKEELITSGRIKE